MAKKKTSNQSLKEELKELEAEREQLLLLSMKKEKEMRTREDKLEIEKEKLEKELARSLEIKEMFLLQADILDGAVENNPKYVIGICKEIGISKSRLTELLRVTRSVRENDS